jgi:hypothetical protein
MFFGLRKEAKVEMDVSSNGEEEDNSKKGLEGTGLVLPINRHSNLKSASSDNDFTQILTHIKSSKTPVSNNQTNHYPMFSLHWFFLIILYAICHRRCVFDYSVAILFAGCYQLWCLMVCYSNLNYCTPGV